MSLKEIHLLLRDERGVSLLEAIIFIAVLALIILAIVFSTTQSLKRTQFNIDKLYATRYAEELEEWMRGEKEVDWSTFSARASSPPTTYCMNNEINDCDTESGNTCWDVSIACAEDDFSLGASNGLNNGYKRTLILTESGTRVDVEISVEWIDGPNTFDVTLNSSFSRWE